jgi:thiol:disulfide interchange protein
MRFLPHPARLAIVLGTIAVSPPAAALDSREGVGFKVVSQGCADIGVCYTPQEQWVEIGLTGASRRGSPWRWPRRARETEARR